MNLVAGARPQRVGGERLRADVWLIVDACGSVVHRPTTESSTPCATLARHDPGSTCYPTALRGVVSLALSSQESVRLHASLCRGDRSQQRRPQSVGTPNFCRRCIPRIAGGVPASTQATSVSISSCFKLRPFSKWTRPGSAYHGGIVRPSTACLMDRAQGRGLR